MNNPLALRAHIAELEELRDGLLVEARMGSTLAREMVVLLHRAAMEKRNRLQILNVYYLAGRGDPQPYPTISPVNSFRLVFDTWFGTSYGFLPDQSFLGDTPDPVP